MDAFARRLLGWYDRCGRHDLPWQDAPARRRSAYRVWIAEVMLQQTQVATVVPYFERFLATLPDLRTLAAADEDQVLALWSGLGYYRRARNLHAAAKQCVARYRGRLPLEFDALAGLPGIGRSTAGAILAQACGQRHPILDGNVRRVLARYHGVRGWPGERKVERIMWAHAEAHTPEARTADYTQAIMDLGATVCTRSKPRCDACPLARDCTARRTGCTADLPTRRARKVLPERQTMFIVLRDRRGRVLLQRRPPAGVWPGLWSLPEAADSGSARQLAARLAELDGSTATVLPEIRHAFTHFRLRATPLEWSGVQPPHAIADAAGSRWWARTDLASLGIPAPVRKLLENPRRRPPPARH